MHRFRPPPRSVAHLNEHPSPAEPDAVRTMWHGVYLLVASMLFFVGTMYALVVSKIIPLTGHPLFDWIARDWYYCLLVPLLIPVAMFVGYLNWMAMKFFRHN
eukprot:gnl/Hemi2/24569_TR8265_c0_g1_i1.p2 gnl/Hemi2/24569_TR8265_c0_g1~~gnl/Hemi2/24569_TR8265_c0_g1_i1.p2  ORF type:complete len:102 (-),score=14.59 gnl/Hemi2/24569_TR8265_c0_g1_i1:345-650(-)